MFCVVVVALMVASTHAQAMTTATEFSTKVYPVYTNTVSVLCTAAQAHMSARQIVKCSASAGKQY